MNIFALILGLVPSIVKGIQTVVGDKASGATKAQMAHDALNAAVQGATGVLTGNNAVYSQAAAEVAQAAIDTTVQVAKASGAYQKWTAVANSLGNATQTAGQVLTTLSQSTELTPQPAATAGAPKPALAWTHSPTAQ